MRMSPGNLPNQENKPPNNQVSSPIMINRTPIEISNFEILPIIYCYLDFNFNIPWLHLWYKYLYILFMSRRYERSQLDYFHTLWDASRTCGTSLPRMLGISLRSTYNKKHATCYMLLVTCYLIHATYLLYSQFFL